MHPTRHLRGVDLKAERVRAGLTQRQLGKRLGVSGSRIANVEATYRPAPTIIRRILAAIETEISSLPADGKGRVGGPVIAGSGLPPKDAPASSCARPSYIRLVSSTEASAD